MKFDKIKTYLIFKTFKHKELIYKSYEFLFLPVQTLPFNPKFLYALALSIDLTNQIVAIIVRLSIHHHHLLYITHS